MCRSILRRPADSHFARQSHEPEEVQPDAKPHSRGNGRYVLPPSPEEIAERTAAIRAGWDAETTASRMNQAYAGGNWVLPEIELARL